MRVLATFLALLFAVAAQAQQISGGGGSSSITSGVTTCTSCPANSIATSNGTIVTFTTTPIAASLALGGATIGTNALAVTGTSQFSTTSTYLAGGFRLGFVTSTNYAYDINNVDVAVIGVGTSYLGWVPSTNPQATVDTRLSRNAAGVVQVGTTAANASGSLLANTLRTNGFTVGTLPAGVTGARAYVTDQNAACVATGAALTGGGAVVCPVFYNGSAWVGG